MNKGIIFDVDGTILDSMKIWMDAGKIYLDKFGIEEKENIAEVLFDLTMAEGAKYIKETYKLDKTIQEIIDGINSVVYEFYENEAMPKDGVLEFIEYLYENKIPMTVATSTDRPMIEAAFKRLGLEKYFKKIFTTTEVGGKWYILDAQSNGFLLGTDTWIKQAGMSWDTKGLPTCSKTDYKR